MSSPYTQKIGDQVPAVAANADADQIVGVAPLGGTVTAVSFTPEAAMTGHTTESRTLTLVNKGQAGIGTVVIATLAFIATVDGVAFDAKAFTLSVVAGATTVVAGDTLALVSTHVGTTGLADPGGRVEVTISRGEASA